MRKPGPNFRPWWALLLLLGTSALARAQMQGVVVFTEIMYHPLGGGQDLEFIEIYNTTPHPVDMSGWFFSRGIAYTFPDGVWLDGKRYLVICADRDRIAAEYSITNALGNWGIGCGSSVEEERSGCSLSNAGETIELSEPTGAPVARVEYNDRGKWPAGADGTGFSLSIRSVHAEQDDPDSWTLSAAIGGTPGRANTIQDAPIALINEGLLLTPGERWIELYNPSDTEIADLSGLWFSDERALLLKSRIPDGTIIQPRSWRVFTESEIGLDLDPTASGTTPPRTFLALTRSVDDAGTPVVDAIIDAYIFEPLEAERSEARYPDGDQTILDRAPPTPGGANESDLKRDIVINEVMYHPIEKGSRGEYIELFNRSAERSIDLSGWELTQGFNYEFPDGVVLGPQEYLVIARDPEHIREVYGLPESAVLGPDPSDPAAVARFGRLRDAGEKIRLADALGNEVDAVRYYDGGDWPVWADGGGSSLELIDPWQNNNVGSAWDASDDSGKAEVRQYSYQGTYLTGQPELHIALAHRGITVMDDLRIFERVVVLEPIETYIDVGDEWLYFKGTQEPSDPRDAWRQLEFDDSGWLAGPTPIGYGDGDEATLLDDMQDNYISFFCRKRFEISSLEGIQSLVLQLELDDGAIAYLNGVRVTDDTEGNMREGQDTYDSRARSSREKLQVQVDLTERLDLLRIGTNVLAVQVHNSTVGSTDARFIARLLNGVFVNQDGPSQLDNGDFEQPIRAGLSVGAWLIEGTHVRSGRTFVDPIAGTASLKVLASAKGDNKVNRLEATLPALTIRSNYTIEFKARWVIGAPTLLTHGHNLASANFDYPTAHTLAVPQQLGTPGAANTVTLRQIDRTASSNLGPVISKVEQTPALPPAGREVEVTARVQDSDGVGEVKLIYWPEDSAGRPGPAGAQEIAMEGPFGRDRYRATIPGQALRTRVVFHIAATDAGGRSGRYPVDRLERTHPYVLDPASADERSDQGYLVYRHDNPVNPARGWMSYRFWMPYTKEMELIRQRLLSNERYEGSLLFQNEDIYYGSRTRWAGSPWARAGIGGSYRVYMPKDRPLNSAFESFNMEDHQNGATSCFERLSHYLIRHNQGTTRVPYSFVWMVQWQMNDRINTAREHYLAPNQQFVNFWFPDDDEGHLFELDDRFEINDGGTRQSSIDARWTYPPMRTGDGDDKENYRWFFGTRMNKGLDDFTQLIEGAKILDSRITPDALFDEVVWDYFDIDQMLRVWSIRMNTDDWDTWGTDRGKNSYVYRPDKDGRWRLFAWDMELTYSNVSAFLPGTIAQPYSTINTGKFPEVYRLINRPRIKRMYYGIMNDMITHQFNSGFLAPYYQRLNALGLSGTDRMRPGGWIDQRAGQLRSRVSSAIYPQVRLAVTSNGGDPFTVEEPLITLEGRAPVDVAVLQFASGGLPLEVPASVEFSSSDYFGWSAQIALAAGVNQIDVLGFSTRGSLVDSDSIEITLAPLKAAIDSVEPSPATVGTPVEIRGSNFFVGMPVTFDGVSSTSVDYRGVPDRIVAEIPSGVMPGPVSVVVGSGALQSDAFTLIVTSAVALFVRGDADRSGRLTINDGVEILFHLFRGGPLECEDAADADDSGRINLTDAVVVLNYLFRRGPPPGAPFPEPGEDPTEDDLSCDY